jgi:Tfp pilus assembly protein PilV
MVSMNTRHHMGGLTTIELVIVVSLFAFVLVSLVGLHLVALSAGTTAETSSIAVNLARARMEELLALPIHTLTEQNDTEKRAEVPAGGRAYLVHTAVAAPDPAWLDLTVTVTWQLPFGAACALSGDCAGSVVTYTRTLQTRVQAAVKP